MAVPEWLKDQKYVKVSHTRKHPLSTYIPVVNQVQVIDNAMKELSMNIKLLDPDKAKIQVPT